MIEDRFSGTTQTLDFYHASQRLWELAHYLYPQDAEAARVFVEPLLHQLRHGESSRVITRLVQILPKPSLQGHLAHDDCADPQLERQIQYFLNHRDHLDYQAVAERDAPIGSGAVGHNAASSKIGSNAQASSGLARKNHALKEGGALIAG